MNANMALFAAAAMAAWTMGCGRDAVRTDVAEVPVAETEHCADFTGVVPPSYPLCAPFVDDQIETVEGFLVVKSVEDHPNPRNAGVEPGDICLSWGTGGPKPPETLRDAWLDFLNWGRSDEDDCWFARERDGRIEVFSCGGCELYECEVALGTFCLELAPTAFPKEEAERIRAAARASGNDPADESPDETGLAGCLKEMHEILNDGRFVYDRWVDCALTSRERRERFDVTYADPGRTVFSYRHEAFLYTGGAHGTSRVRIGTVERRTGRKLTVDDVIPADRRGEALALVKKAVLEKIGGEENLQGAVRLTENFCVAEDGLHFLFNEYEVAAYGFGDVEVVIPAYGDSAGPRPPAMRERIRPTGRAHSPFSDGLSALEEMEPTGADTAAASDELVPPHLGLAFGMSAERTAAVRPGLRRDGERSRPGRMVASATLPESEGGGDCGVVYGKGYVVAGLFRGWSVECGFTPTNPGPVRVDLDDALVRLGAPTVRRVVPVPGGYRHVWAWTKGGRALSFEIERKQPHGSLEDEIRANVVAGDTADDGDGFWASTVGRTVDWDRADRILYTYSDAPLPKRKNVRLELSEAGADGIVTDGRGTVLRSFHEPLPDFPAVRKALRDARVRWFGREKDAQPLVGGSEEFLTVFDGVEPLAEGAAETGDEIWLGPYPYPKKIREVLLEALPFEIEELDSGVVLKNP